MHQPRDAPPPGHEDRADGEGLGKPDKPKNTPSPAHDGFTDEQLVELFGIVRPEPSPEVLSSPTIGAIRRQQGEAGWSNFAKIYFATLLVQEAQRRVLLEQLDGVMQFLAAGATPDQAVTRLVDLVDDYHGAGTRLTRGELAA